ncbi:MAG: leucine-rich repeat domain-containing protein [Oscillospiraceae bacterium]|nr:leucine-rich repeat domain-containing protein [Oscillospiraceae bacterium]
MEVDELFRFIKNTDKKLGGYAVAEYLKKDDRTVTDVKIPAEHNGLPVTMLLGCCFASARSIRRVSMSVRFIADNAFVNCASLEAAELCEGIETIGVSAFERPGLKSVKLPKSLKRLGNYAFRFCRNLESAEFGSAPSEFGSRVFHECDKLPAETFVMGLVRSTDITSPIRRADFQKIKDNHIDEDCEYFRPDVFELLAKNNCFRNCRVKDLFEEMIREDRTDLIPIAGEYGMLSDAELVDTLIDYCAERGKPEVTAYLLDLKKRMFGFEGGRGYEL